MSDWLAEALREISDNFESLGGQGRIGITMDVPVKVVIGGREFRSTVQVRWTEDGPQLVDPDRQALRIAKEAKKDAVSHG